MVKCRRIQNNESSKDEEGDMPQLISSQDTANEEVDRGLNEANEITPRRKKYKKESTKKSQQKTFKECINTYLQNEKEGYNANLRELSPKVSKRDKMEVQRSIEADYPTNNRDLLDKIQKEYPTETATHRNVVTTSTPKTNADSNRLKQVNFKRRRDSLKNGRTLVNSLERSDFQEESPRQPPAKKGRCKINPVSSKLRTDHEKE
ncbi:Hypothetical protein SRAE_X000234000 [Strongyloides ratti]|uniref:Uncharacterized protein n=1 Tax=Strongyloides ratti TaxID=34506 RepID=A0A090KSY0_STRRB|nr:Hypothetical protein SRAE_X000234000 [Strongyloides ratti]CEF60605.1 Hypothetical protein SRAE_X000234000 [Strongyloides ratti]